MANLLFYQRPVRLNRFAHADLRYMPPRNYMFCRDVTAVALMGVEFPAACRQYPIVFIQAPDGTLSPHAVLSVQAGENAFVDHQGQWTATYIPAFIRRYPFVLAAVSDNSSDYDVAFDEASDCFSRDYGEPLFSPQGEPEAALRSQMEFLRAFQQEHQRTQDFIQKLEDVDLLIPQNVDVVRADRQRFGVRNALIVDEAKLTTLPPTSSHAFLVAGYLGWIYAHLISLQCFVALANRAGHPLEELAPWWAK